jgi:hypothetical protein
MGSGQLDNYRKMGCANIWPNDKACHWTLLNDRVAGPDDFYHFVRRFALTLILVFIENLQSGP